MSAPLLEVRDLCISRPTPEGGEIDAVSHLSLQITTGESLGLLGESGCGKSTLALAIMGLLPGARLRGEILWRGQPLLSAPASAHRALRGRGLSMVFQEAASSLNPLMRIGAQVAEALPTEQRGTRRDAQRHSVELLERVHLPDAARWARAYPHELSGGMRQRVLLAIALASRPQLLIADEPTTALDLRTQAQILALLREEQARSGLALLLISHDLGVIHALCPRMIVMHAGRCVEAGATAALLRAPQQPYTQQLVARLPRGQATEHSRP